MPKQFTGSVEPPKDMQFGANSFVDSSNSLEGLQEGAKALAGTTGTLVLRKLQSDLMSADDAEQSHADDVRRTKRKVYDAAQSGDQQAVDKFSKQLEDLTIAENQGAISGTNASVRKESLLRSYINRFPHREEEIRQTYSSTRAALQAGRAQKVSDPFEEGLDDVLKESVAKGKSPIAVLEDRQHNDFMQRAVIDFQYQANLGKSVEGEFEQAFDTHAMPVFYSQATDYITMAMSMANEGNGDIQAMTIKRNLEMQKAAALNKVSGTINNIVAAGTNNEYGAPVMSSEFRAAQAKKVADMYDGFIKYADNIDTLTQYKQGLDYLKYQTLSQLRQTDPMLRALIDMGQGEWAGKYLAEDYPKVAMVRFTQGKAGIRALLNNTTNPMEKNRLKLQMQMLDNVNGEDTALDLQNIIKHGAPPVATGDPYVDAVRLSALTDSLANSPDTPPEVKDNAGTAIIEAEKADAGYLALGAHWYKNPSHLQLLSKSEPLKARVREELTGSMATLTKEISADPHVGNSLHFAVDLERDSKEHKFPWKAYKTGGPWSSQVVEKAGDVPIDPRLTSQYEPVETAKPIVNALNNAYWIIRRIDGAPAAEEWANQIFQQQEEDKKKAAEGDAGGDSFDEKPTFDLTD